MSRLRVQRLSSANFGKDHQRSRTARPMMLAVVRDAAGARRQTSHEPPRLSPMRAVASHGLCLWGCEVCDAMPATLIHRHRSHSPCSPPCRLVLRLPWAAARELAPRCQPGTRCLRRTDRCANRESIGKVPANNAAPDHRANAAPFQCARETARKRLAYVRRWETRSRKIDARFQPLASDQARRRSQPLTSMSPSTGPPSVPVPDSL